MDALLWLLALALMVIGLIGTVMPALPGTALVLAGAVLGAWIDDFQRVPGWVLGLLAAMAVASWVLEYLAGLMGAKRVGASRHALVGAALGTVVGLLMGLVGVLFMPMVGAAAGEYLARREGNRALNVGLNTWVGLMLGMLAKLVLAFMMVGVFAGAYFW